MCNLELLQIVETDHAEPAKFTSPWIIACFHVFQNLNLSKILSGNAYPMFMLDTGRFITGDKFN